MSVVQEFTPKTLWKHFDAILQIPRPSTKEQKARDYVLSVANKVGLKHEEDKVGNIVIRKPAHKGRENAPITVLQGHLDMVCEKDEAKSHNFETDAIRPIQKGEWLYADGTTLGADNGIGVSAALAVMESTDIAHGPLELIFTIDEETGLTGAAEFPAGILKAKYFLNLDNEETGTLCIGCSGGLNTTARRKVTLENVSKGNAYRIKVSGLKGGHSGVDIHLGRGNALRILGTTLQQALEKTGARLADVKGGSARNVIPREASAVLVMEGKEAELNDLVAQLSKEAKIDLGGFDPEVQITVEKVETPRQAMSTDDGRAVADLLATIPHGVIAMSPDIPGLVQTSTNLAVVSLKDGTVEIATSQRSAIRSSILAAGRLVATVCRRAGFEAESGGGYPGWKPEPESELVQKCKDVYQKTFGGEPRLIAMHAGLECGVIGDKYPGMQLISFGPTIESPHSPIERVNIPTVDTFWKYLVAVLENV